MQVDKFGRFRSTSGNNSFLQLQHRLLKRELFNILIDKNLDKLILSCSDSTNGSVRIKNVECDSNSEPTDAVNISYLKRRTRDEVEKFVRALNFDKLVLAPSETNSLSIRIRNVATDVDSLPGDAVNVSYLTTHLRIFSIEIEKLEKRIESLENLLVQARSITYSTDTTSASLS